MAVSGLLFVGANATWNGLGYLNPLAWFLEWSSVVLAFLCVFASVRTTELKNHIYGYVLITVSLLIAAISYILSVTAPQVSNAISQSINPYYFLVLAIPLLLMPFLVRLDLKKLDNSKFAPLFFFILVIVSLAFLLYMFSSISPPFPTDESVFDMYAAHLFLSGLNPYNPALMANAFTYYHFMFQAFDPITPLTTGGYVNSLTYPALSFLIFIPAVLLKLKASVVMLPILIAPVVIVWFRAWSRKKWLHSAYAILPFIALLSYVYQGSSADTDALWATLLMFSYLVLPRAKSSGVLFGLALAAKQFPIIVAPFFLYFIYREYGTNKTLIWIAFSTTSFFLVNGYFVFQDPMAWIHSMVANEFAPLIGIGFGLPQISFAGFLHIPTVLFTIAMLDSLIAFLVIYILKYGELKYALFAFPILIFIFNSRLFPQYMYYWMLISLLPMIDLMAPKRQSDSRIQLINSKYNLKLHKIKTRALVAVLAVLIVGSLTLEYHEIVQNPPGSFNINSVSYRFYNTTGYVDKMDLTISYQGNGNSTHVFFRVFPNGPIVNGNMLLWMADNSYPLLEGRNYNITIFPQYPEYSVNPDGGFMVVAYYGSIQGSLYVPANEGTNYFQV